MNNLYSNELFHEHVIQEMKVARPMRTVALWEWQSDSYVS